MRSLTTTIGVFAAITVLLTSSTVSSSSAQSIGISTAKTEIYPRDEIFVTGFVDADSFYKTVRLTVYDPSGNVLYRPDVYYDDNGRFSWLFHPPIPSFEQGTYTIVASHEDVAETSELQIKVTPKPSESPMNSLSSSSSIAIEEVVVVDSDSTMESLGEETTNTGNEGNQESTSTLAGDTDTTTSQRQEPDTMISSESSKEQSEVSNMIESVGNAGSNNEFVQSNEFVTTVGIIIAGMVAGIVLWLRSSHLKQTIQK